MKRQPEKDDYILVEFASNKNNVYYVAKVLQARGDTCFVSFLRKKLGKNVFYMPQAADISDVDQKDIKTILPKPHINGSTSRQNAYFTFNVDMSSIDCR